MLGSMGTSHGILPPRNSVRQHGTAQSSWGTLPLDPAIALFLLNG